MRDAKRQSNPSLSGWNRGRLLALAACKLLIDLAVYYFAAYGPLKKWGAFSHMVPDYRRLNAFLASHRISAIPYSAYFIGGLTLSGALYLAVIGMFRIRRRLSWLLCSFLLVPDLLFVLQPGALLLTVAFFVVLLALLRINDPRVRYPLCALWVIAYGLLISRAALAIIPIYLLVRLWQKNDTAGIRVTVLLLLVFCFLYQSGLVARVYELHPGVSADATYRRLFPDENYMGHVSYYLLDTLLTLLRILFPFEVFTKVAPLLWICGAAQIATTLFVLYTFRQMLSVDWSKPVRREDRLAADSVTILGATAVALSFSCREPLEAFRALSACYPFLVYLAYGADRSKRYPIVDRDLSGACPVVFFHTGFTADLSSVLQQAARMCGYRNVVLLGDETNRGLLSNWYDAEELVSEELKEFRELYAVFDDAPADSVQKICFERYFLLYEFLTRKNIKRCFLCDSDVLLYGNLCGFPMEDVDFAYAGTAADEFLKEQVSPHCTYWTTQRLRKFLDFLVRIYRSNTRWLTDVRDRQTEDGGPAYLTDAVLVAAWCKLSSRYDKNFRHRNLCEVRDGVTWDLALSSPGNLSSQEYRFLPGQKRKIVHFRGGKPYFIRQDDGSEVRAVCLHCRSCRSYIPLLLRETTLPLWYHLTRFLYE